MSNKKLINELAASGRFGDDFLLHINGEELVALDALAPGGLTTNPDTGLPEAFGLADILPAVAGVAGSFVGLPPWATAAAVGGAKTVATGDLGKGLTAGLMSYGAGNLASGLAEAGAAPANTAAMNAADVGSQASQGADVLGQAAQQGVAETAAPSFLDNMQAGMGSFGDVAGQSKVWQPLAAGTLGTMMQQDGGIGATTEMPEDVSYGPGPQLKKREYNSQAADPKGREKTYYFAEGGAISGPGGGLDDLVPATIEGKVPAKLSNDEFVIPADIVSAIGDGSSSAGHSKLYELIKEIREEKYGSSTQPPKMKKGLKELMNLYG